MKKITVIFASPRKKNTFDLVKRTEEEMKKLGPVEFDYIFLKNSDIRPCMGCFNCFTKGVGVCPLKDDRMEIEKNMEESDGVIFATPVYAMTMSALLKNFMERSAYLCHRPKFFDKPAMFIATTGGVGLKETFKAMDTFQTWGFHSTVKLGLVSPPFKPRQSFIRKRNKEITEKSLKFHNLVNVDRIPDPPLNMVLFFHAFRKMTKIAPQELPEDYRYWKKNGWHERKAHYFRNDVRVGPLKRILGNLMSFMIEKGARKDFEISG
jgi:putative NADPH-quinone reductase